MKKIHILFLTLLITFYFSNAGEEIPIFQEDKYCNFNELVLEGKSENYPHIVGIVLEKNGNKVLVKPIHDKKYDKVLIELDEEIELNEEIEFFVLDDDKVCISKRGLR